MNKCKKKRLFERPGGVGWGHLVLPVVVVPGVGTGVVGVVGVLDRWRWPWRKSPGSSDQSLLRLLFTAPGQVLGAKGFDK